MESIARWIGVLHRQFQIYLNRELKNYDVNSSEYIFLVNLHEDEGISQEQLSTNLYIDKAATARAIARLEKSGYVRRAPDRFDSRAYSVTLTTEGKEMQQVIKTKLAHWRNTISAGLPEGEIEDMLCKIKHMSANALHETGREVQ